MLRSTVNAALAAAALLACTAIAPHTPVFVDGSQPATVSVGEEFFIALTSNPTTGYSWSQSGADGKTIAYEGNVYEPLAQFNDNANGSIGAAGQQIFVYHAIGTGQTTLSFAYSRPFEKNVPPAKSVTFTVTVQ